MKEKELLERMKKALSEVTSIIAEIQSAGLQNEQYSLNFLDELNKLSVIF